MTQASSLEKEKAKALEKAALQQAKASGLQDGEVDPPDEEPEPPSEEQQILAQTRKQASKAEAMVRKLQKSWTKLWKRSRASSPERSRPQHWPTLLP